MTWLSQLFDTSDFPARWHCGTWTAAHGWTHIIADLATWAAYFAIPILLINFVRKKSDVVFPRLFWFFGAFILACGTVHLIEASIFWWPWYRLSATFKVITAIVSWLTVFAIIPLIPKALSLPGMAEMIDRLQFEVSARKRSEALLLQHSTELEMRNRELDDFAHVASHDLQEPLRKIELFTQMLEQDIGPSLSQEAEKDMERIADSATRMRRLINDLLTLSRTGRTELTVSEVDLRKCVNDAIESLETRVAEQNAEIKIDSLPSILGDQTLLTLLFQNLIGNALKFMPPERRPEIHITAEQVDGEWVIGVRDNGIGIKPEYQDKIFTAFKRLHNRGEYEGSGIGLAMCKRTITRHGGRIWVESAEQGSHFKFQIPNKVQESSTGTVANHFAFDAN